MSSVKWPNPLSSKIRLDEAQATLTNMSKYREGGGLADHEDHVRLVRSKGALVIYPPGKSVYGETLSPRIMRAARKLAKKLGLDLEETKSGSKIWQGMFGRTDVLFATLKPKHRAQLPPISVQSVGDLHDLERVARKHEYRRSEHDSLEAWADTED